MDRTVRKTLTFSTDQTPVTNNSPIMSSGGYTDFMDRAFGQLYIHPVGHSTPGQRVGEESVLSSSLLSSQYTGDLYLSFQADSLSESQSNATLNLQATMANNVTQNVHHGYSNPTVTKGVNTSLSNALSQGQTHSPFIRKVTNRGNQTESNAFSLNTNVGDLLLQPCSTAQIWGQNGNTLSNPIQSQVHYSDRYQLFDTQGQTQAPAVTSSQRNITEPMTQAYSHTAPTSQPSMPQYISSAHLNFKENNNEYASCSRQQEQLQQQFTQQMIKDQEEELLRRQHPIALILQQQEQQLQQLQQQKYAFVAQHASHDNIPLQQELPQAHNTANSYINPVSLQAPQHMNRLSETAFTDGHGYATTNPEANCNFLEEKHIHMASSSQHGPVYTSNSLQQNPSLQINASNPEMQGQYLPIPTTVDRNTASLGAQQIQTTSNTRQPVIVSSTEHMNLSPANSGQGLGIQFPPTSNVGCMSGNEPNAQSTVDGRQNNKLTAVQSQLQSSSARRKEIQPDNFDGSGATEWPDYIIHFEHCAEWNQWNELQKAKMLTIHLRGEAQKLLSNLSEVQRNDFEKLKRILSDRYDPKEKEVTYRCQFRHFRRDKGVTASDYGYNLRKLAQKAYPDLTLDQLEVHVIDQFINGLGHRELQKHVQYRHPRTLHEAIGLATEYEALEGSLDRVKKPSNEETTVASLESSNCKQEAQAYPSITLDQISKLIDTKLDKLLPRKESRDKIPINQMDTSPARKTEYFRSRSPERKSNPQSPVRPRNKMFCTFCKRKNHSTENCYSRKRQEEKLNETETGLKSAYAITSRTNDTGRIIPTITITAPDNSATTYADTKEQDPSTQQNTTTQKLGQNEVSKEVNSISNLQEETHEEINVNTSVTSCLYLTSSVYNYTSKFLIDTDSPYSILSKNILYKFQTEENLQMQSDNTRLRAADGNVIQTSGKLSVPLQIDQKVFQQVFIIANIQGIDGIIGMDFLHQYDAVLNIKKQTLTTRKGKIKLSQQTSNTCARIQLVDTTVIPPNTEIFLKGKIEQPCIRKESISIAEPTRFLANKGCLIARTLVNPTDKDILMSILNLSDEAVKVNQNSVIGILQEVEELPSPDRTNSIHSSQSILPEHLQSLIQNASDKLTPEEKQKLAQLLTQYQDIFMEPNGKLGQTNIAEHEINTANHGPIKIPPRRIPIFKRELVDQELDKMIEQEIVEPSDSPWSAPICLVKKKDGTCRFCIDFTKT